LASREEEEESSCFVLFLLQKGAFSFLFSPNEELFVLSLFLVDQRMTTAPAELY